MNILIGADPELFVKRDGKFVSGWGMIEGTKENPFKVENGAVQVDGMALEFNINPAKDEAEFVRNIKTVTNQLQAMVEGELVPEPTAHFEAEVMAAQPQEALILGCEPDFNAYQDGQANPAPNGDVPFRTGGGHVHVGWTEGMDINDEGHREAAIMLAKQLDFYLGLPSLFWDDDQQRREMYGRPGAFRVKPYGMEYRSLSNAWLRKTSTVKRVYNNTRLAVEHLLAGKTPSGRHQYYAVEAINRGDRELARRLWEVNGLGRLGN